MDCLQLHRPTISSPHHSQTFIMAAALAASGVVVGMRQLTGEVRPRMDIDVLLMTQPDTFNLFLQALVALQGDPKLLGYYALAGE